MSQIRERVISILEARAGARGIDAGRLEREPYKVYREIALPGSCLPRQLFHHYVYGPEIQRGTRVTRANLDRLSRGLGINLEWLTTGNGKPEAGASPPPSMEGHFGFSHRVADTVQAAAPLHWTARFLDLSRQFYFISGHLGGSAFAPDLTWTLRSLQPPDFPPFSAYSVSGRNPLFLAIEASDCAHAFRLLDYLDFNHRLEITRSTFALGAAGGPSSPMLPRKRYGRVFQTRNSQRDRLPIYSGTEKLMAQLAPSLYRLRTADEASLLQAVGELFGATLSSEQASEILQRTYAVQLAAPAEQAFIFLRHEFEGGRAEAALQTLLDDTHVVDVFEVRGNSDRYLARVFYEDSLDLNGMLIGLQQQGFTTSTKWVLQSLIEDAAATESVAVRVAVPAATGGPQSVPGVTCTPLLNLRERGWKEVLVVLKARPGQLHLVGQLLANELSEATASIVPNVCWDVTGHFDFVVRLQTCSLSAVRHRIETLSQSHERLLRAEYVLLAQEGPETASPLDEAELRAIGKWVAGRTPRPRTLRVEGVRTTQEPEIQGRAGEPIAAFMVLHARSRADIEEALGRADKLPGVLPFHPEAWLDATMPNRAHCLRYFRHRADLLEFARQLRQRVLVVTASLVFRAIDILKRVEETSAIPRSGQQPSRRPLAESTA